MGLPPRDFRTRYGFRRYARSGRIWSLDFTFAVAPVRLARGALGRGRQVSTLSPRRFARACASTHRPKLSSVLQPP